MSEDESPRLAVIAERQDRGVTGKVLAQLQKWAPTSESDLAEYEYQADPDIQKQHTAIRSLRGQYLRHLRRRENARRHDVTWGGDP